MRFHRLAITALALILGFAPFAAAQCVNDDDNDGVQCFTLYAGQTIEAGSVCLEVVNDDLQVTYTTTGDWTLNECHLWVGGDIADMPQTRKGNPVPGKFPYNSGDISGSTSHTFLVSLASLGFSCPGDDANYLVAAHAAIERPDGNGGTQGETAWSDGDRFVERGNWGTFSTITLTCDCGSTPPPPPADCETAFAKASSGDTCFLDIDEDGNGTGDFNRWGWTNKITGAGNYEFEIYAGAGQCDTNKGTYVGTLYVDYDGSSVDVTYAMADGYTMEEIHLYTGNEILARDVNGDFTVAPGQYDFVIDLDNATTYSQNDIPESGEIYVVAHAVVCGF